MVLAGTALDVRGRSSRAPRCSTGGLIRIEPRTPLQAVNHGTDELLLYAYGTPPEDERAEISNRVVNPKARDVSAHGAASAST